MTAFFSGVTNAPITSAIISIELFGMEGFILFAARLISGKINLYKK